MPLLVFRHHPAIITDRGRRKQKVFLALGPFLKLVTVIVLTATSCLTAA